MKDQFLKIAGVKTQKEFYNKYPSEEAFFKAHPEAKHLKTMAKGGSTGNEQQQIMKIIQAYAQSQGIPPKQLMQQLQQMQPQQQQQALQQMVQAVTSGANIGYGSGVMPMAEPGFPKTITPFRSYSNGGNYSNVPQHANPGTYNDGYSGTSNAGQYFAFGGFNIKNPFGDVGEGMRDGSLTKLAASTLPMLGMENQWAYKNASGKDLKGDLSNYLANNPNANKDEIMKMLDSYSQGGMAAQGYIPEYGSQAYGPTFAYGGINDLPRYSNAGHYFPDGGQISPEDQAAMAQQNEQMQSQSGQQAPDQNSQQQNGGAEQQQQIVQQIAEMLQQGAQPQEILQQLVQQGIPQEVAQQLLEAVMQQMQGAGQEQQPMPQGQPGMMYGGVSNLHKFVGGRNPQQPDLENLHNSYMKARGGMVGQEMEVSPAQMEQLRKQGYKFDLI